MPPIRIQPLAILCLGIFLGQVQAEEPWRVETRERLVAVSDIHGANDAFVAILERVGMIGPDQEWTGGNSRLVIVGDVLDRGPDSRQALDLIMALQEQSRARGGDVLFVLGNHEIMNLVGDLRYVSSAEFASYAGEGTAETRAAAFERFLEQSEEPADVDTARSEFDRRFPVGFFAHREAFSSAGAYGRWLIEQPVLLVAGDTAFVHGGVSRAYEGIPGERINSELKQQLRDYLTAMEMLLAAGVLAPTDGFYDHPSIVDRYAARVAAGEAAWSAEIETAAQRLEELNDAPIFALASPIWYRGMAGCSPLVESDHWAQTLQQLDVDRIVIGHTPTADARVLSRMADGILRIDTGMLSSYYGGRAAALSITDGALEVAYGNVATAAAPTPQPRRVGGRPNRLTDDELESLLREAAVVGRTETETQLRVTLRAGDVEVEADFYPAARSSVRPEVAAYRLDRLLGLEMVPVTVARDIDGIPGALQFVPSNMITEAERSSLGTGGAAWCPLRDQYPAMYVFDTLVYNEGRDVQRIAYETESFQLLLLGHERTFGTQRGRPPHLRDTALEVNAAWQAALSTLDEDRLTEALGDVLTRRQIRALARRIDEVREEAASR